MKNFLTVPEAAEKASVCQATIRAWIEQYGIGIKVGGRWRIPKEEFDKFLDGTIHEELRRTKHETNEAGGPD